MKTTAIRALGVFLVAAALVFSSTALAKHRGKKNLVVIGGAISQTGRFAEPAGRMYNSVKLYVDQMNKRGGLLGHRVILIMLDDKSDKQTSIKLYEKLITEDKVDLIMAPYSSGITDAVANVTERYQMPMVAYGAASSVIWQRGRKYIFNIIDIAENYQVVFHQSVRKIVRLDAVYANIADATVTAHFHRRIHNNARFFA